LHFDNLLTVLQNVSVTEKNLSLCGEDENNKQLFHWFDISITHSRGEICINYFDLIPTQLVFCQLTTHKFFRMNSCRISNIFVIFVVKL